MLKEDHKCLYPQKRSRKKHMGYRNRLPLTGGRDAAFAVSLAQSVVVLMNQACIMDTIVHGMSELLQNRQSTVLNTAK